MDELLIKTNEGRAEMERLTHKARYEAGYKLNKGIKEWQASDRLGAYENTGLTPEQIQELKERDTAKAPVKDAESRIRYTDSFICPNCGKHFTGVGIAEFCYRCGQRLKWEE